MQEAPEVDYGPFIPEQYVSLTPEEIGQFIRAYHEVLARKEETSDSFYGTQRHCDQDRNIYDAMRWRRRIPPEELAGDPDQRLTVVQSAFQVADKGRPIQHLLSMMSSTLSILTMVADTVPMPIAFTILRRRVPFALVVRTIRQQVRTTTLRRTDPRQTRPCTCGEALPASTMSTS